MARARQDGSGILVEAKAPPAELSSSCGAGEKSLAQIRAALDAAKPAYGVTADYEWLIGYCPYTDRLAHLELLRRSGLHAYLVFLYFVGDSDTPGPQSSDEWKSNLSGVRT